MYISDLISLKETLKKIQFDYQIKGLILFGSDKNRPSTDEISSALSLNSKPLLGGIFPEIIAEGQRKEEGFVLIPLYEELEVAIFENTDQADNIDTQIASWLTSYPNDIGSVFCFVNAFWQYKTTFMNSLYNELGPFVNYLGGGAGSLSFESFPCIFANQSIHENAAVIGTLKQAITIGTAHGWHPISDVIKVTETNGNAIVTLNYQPAFKVYKEIVETHSKQNFSDTNFFDIAKSYPLGLVKLDDEMIVRDPYNTKDDVLYVVDEVPQGEYIRIMNGNIESLLEGAKKAVDSSNNLENFEGNQICIDCISRVLFMKEDFAKELNFLNINQVANGVLSIGEIANPGNTVLELYNKTVVVAKWN
jgi:hypothetical protein